MADPTLISSNQYLAALSAAWYWNTHNANNFSNGVALNDQALKIKWNDNAVPDTQESEFKKISKGVGAADPEGRWDFYKNNVSELLKGGNSYESMRAALTRVGVTTVTGQNYNQQFGITLAKHKPVEIVGSKTTNLMATTGEALSETPDGPDLTAEQEAQLWAQAEPLFEQLKQSPEETSAMWIPDIRLDVGLLVGAAVAVAVASPAQAEDNYVYGVCRVSPPGYGTMIRPTYAGGSYLVNYHGNDPRYKEKLSSGEFFAGAKVTLIKAPAHGNVILEEGPWSSETDYQYRPNDGYAGKDRFVMQVDKNGVKVRIHYLMVVPQEGESLRGHCNPESWKISAITPAPDDANLAALLANAGRNLGFADLSGVSVGQATGTGSEARITLDTTAAGHGWYIDYTPFLNEEFLPTSNPNEWIAKAGSEAEGKMDLLSVLLHEYGHALGLEHSTDAHDFMATTLQPGVRRTLTVDDQLALMQLAGFFPTPDSPSAPYGPTDPGAPLPFTRVLSNARNARLRREGALENSLDALVPQFDTVANPKLTNPEFAGAQGWATTGDVAFTNGAATLTETASTQTRLNQVFVLGENDRFLSFTLANSALGDQANGPDDAFEVALIDASTGLSLMGGTGLTHNDAIVNRQADGSEYKATGINVVNNADGSRTYLVDLAGVNKNGAAGTVVNLAFDLIGFGSGAAATNSHLTIRDLRLGVPQTTDDTATLAEDSPAIIDALANDLNARQPGFTPVVVSGPSHGQVAIDAEGRFTYTPEANWNGTDSFTYKISDSHVDSNLATVTLTVTPVNDVPVIAARSVTLDEDSTVIVDLLAGASDVDGDALSVAITTAPQHGTLNQNVDGTWTYVPAANWNGTDVVEYEVSDGTAVTPTRLALIVNAVNDALGK